MGENKRKKTVHPDHLCGARAIARVFSVSRGTVARWKEAGAPIVRVGKCFQAQYAELWAWLKRNDCWSE